MGGRPRLNTEEFIRRSVEKHGNKYDYSKTKYIDQKTDVLIRCPKHGFFYQKPQNHYYGKGKGCKRCAAEKWNQIRPDRRPTYQYDELQEFIGDTEILNSPREFHDSETITIYCEQHGEVRATISALVRCSGCPTCYKAKRTFETQRLTTQEFIANAINIHGDRFSYKKTKYRTAKTKVTITCHEHGDFTVTPNNHTSMYESGGCKQCGRIGLREETINGQKFLVQGYEDYALQYMVHHGVNVDEIISTHSGKIPVIHIDFYDGTVQRKRHYPDFFLPERNLLVEVKSVATFGFETYFKKKSILIRWIQHKSIMAQQQGFRYKCLVFDRQGNCIRLPKGWERMQPRKLYEWYLNVWP